MLFNNGDQQYQDSNSVSRERQTELQEGVFHDQHTLADRQKSDEVFLKMAKTTTIITQAGQKIEIYHEGKQSQLADWMFGINVERFLYKNHPDKFKLQIEARNAETQEVICIHRYNRLSPNILSFNMRLNEAHEILKSLLTAVESRDGVWDAREQI